MITVDFRTLRLPPDSLILDIGCGSGRHTAAAYARYTAHVIGADANPEDLQQARDRLCFHDNVGACRNGGRWSLNAADITALPFRDGTFDLVICSEVLEHIPDDSAAIREILRVIKPDGDLVVSVPRCWPETLCWWMSRDYRTSEGGHLRIYHTAKLVSRFEARGWRLRRKHHAHSLHVPYWWLKCLLGLSENHVWPVRQFQRFLTWDIMDKPRVTRCLDKLLNPVMGKSVVFYFKKRLARIVPETGRSEAPFTGLPNR